MRNEQNNEDRQKTLLTAVPMITAAINLISAVINLLLRFFPLP